MELDAERLHPLKFDAATGKPYLQLAQPYVRIVLTPQPRGDLPANLANLNDARVYMMLAGMPLLYLEEHALNLMCRYAAAAEAVLACEQFVGACPVRAVRDIIKPSVVEAPLSRDCAIDRNM